MELSQDWHIHTFRSNCAKPDSTVPAIVAKIDEAGLRLAGLADHIDSRQQQGWFETVVTANRKDLASLQPGCRVLIGAEATMLDPGRCALDADLAAELDFVLVACNHYHLDAVENPASRSPRAYADHYVDMVLGAAESGFATSVSHPFYHAKLGPGLALETLQSYDAGRLTEALRAAAQAGMAFEINPRYLVHARQWYRGLVEEARRYGTKFTLGSDAHTLSDLGYGPLPDGVDCGALCDEIGLTEADLRWPE